MAPRVSCSRLASNPTLKHPGHLGVDALLVSRCNLTGTELALHVEAVLEQPLLLLYMTTVQRSRRVMWMESSVKSVGSSERVSSVSVRSGYACHAAQAVFFPIPRNHDVVSLPVNEWNSAKCLGDFMNWDVLESFSSSKAYPQLHHTQAANMSHSNDDNITVDCAAESFRMKTA